MGGSTETEIVSDNSPSCIDKPVTVDIEYNKPNPPPITKLEVKRDMMIKLIILICFHNDFHKRYTKHFNFI